MKTVKNGSNTDFQIKIGDKYVTIASLVPWFISEHFHKYELYFYYYGEEYTKGTYACQHINGNVSMTVWLEKYERWEDFIRRISKIISKKLYIIGNSILDEIKSIESIEERTY